ncbi:MAG: hypothetical protein ACQESF_05635 [Nanobdellota archaeon]
MGSDITNQLKPLGKEEREYTKEMLNRHYNKLFPDILSNLNGKKLHPRFGIETEYHGVDEEFMPIPYAGKKVKEIYPEVDEDCGNHMLELNSSPISANKEGPVQCLEEMIEKENKMRDVYKELFSSNPLPMGILPTFETNEDYDKFIPDRKRAQLIHPYIMESMKPADLRFFERGSNKEINFGKVPGGGFMNSLHISVSATDDRHSVLLYNIANALSAPLIAIAANSPVVDRKVTTYEDAHLFVYEQNREIADGVPRVGNFPEYLDSLNEYFAKMLKFNPIFKFDEHDPVRSLHNHFSCTWPWVRAQVDNFYRVEFRPTPKQPTLIEDMAVSGFFLYSLLAYEEEMDPIRYTDSNISSYCSKKLFNSKYLIENSHNAAINGLDAKIKWNDKRVPVVDVLNELYTKAVSYAKRNGVGKDNLEILEVIEQRIKNNVNPSRKFVSEIDKYGFDEALSKYSEHTSKKAYKPYAF